MVRLLKALVFLAVIGFIGLVGFAYLGDLSPQQDEVSLSVKVNVD